MPTNAVLNARGKEIMNPVPTRRKPRHGATRRGFHEDTGARCQAMPGALTLEAGPPKARGAGDGSEIHKQPRAMTLALTRIDPLA